MHDARDRRHHFAKSSAVQTAYVADDITFREYLSLVDLGSENTLVCKMQSHVSVELRSGIGCTTKEWPLSPTLGHRL